MKDSVTTAVELKAHLKLLTCGPNAAAVEQHEACGPLSP